MTRVRHQYRTLQQRRREYGREDDETEAHPGHRPIPSLPVLKFMDGDFLSYEAWLKQTEKGSADV